MSTDLAIRPDQSSFDDAQIAALRALGIEDAPVGDLDLFFHQATRTGLDPFAKQIYLIGRNSKVSEWKNGKKVERWVVKYTIQTGIDGFRVIRDRPHTHAYLGQKEEWCGPDGVWHDVWLSDEPPAAAKVSLSIEGYLQPIVGIARYVEYVQTTSSGDPNSMWRKMPAGQLAKCAEALALRKAYPQDLSGVYTDDEMGQADTGADGVPSVTTLQPAAPKRTDAEIAEEWAEKGRQATTRDAVLTIWRDAGNHGFLQYSLASGELLDDVLKARGETLATEEAQRLAGEPEVLDGEPIEDDETPF